MEKWPHRTPEAPLQDNMANGVASLRTKKIRGTASDKEISFGNDNEQLNKTPVIMNAFTAYSDTSGVPTMQQINTTGNDSDTVLIKNINSRCQSGAQNTLPSVKMTVTVTVHTLVSQCGWQSHYRRCKQIKDILNKNFSVTRFISPGSNTVTLADSARETTGSLTKNDVLVFWGLQMA